MFPIYFTIPHSHPNLPNNIISSVGKESACNAGVQGTIPGLGRYPGKGNANPPQ